MIEPSTKRIVARNALCNWAGMATHLLTGFVVAPFLVHELGQTGYGLWILIASLTGYFAVLDLGVGGSVGRNVAFLRAKNDRDGVNSLVSTALAILSGVAGLVLLATLGALALFFVLFDVEPAQADAARLALLLIGCHLAVSFLLGIFDGLFWAMQRFDLQNLIDIPTVLLRAGLTFLFIGQGYGLVALALITLLTSAAAGLVKLAVCFLLDPGLRFRVSLIRRESAGCLYGYGIWFFLLSLARTVTPQISPLVIGARLAVALVTPFSIAARVVGYGNAFLIAGTQVMTPVATGFHAAGHHDQQRRLFLAGGKYCFALGLFFVTVFACLGESLLALWMGPELSAAWILLLVLAVGELLPMSQWITYSMILGMGRHRLTACLNLAEGILVLGLSVVLADSFGVLGVAVAVAVPAAVCRGFGPLLYGCRLVHLPLAGYLIHAFLRPALLALIPGLMLAIVVAWRAPQTWAELFLYAGGYALMYGGIVGVGLLGWQRFRRVGPLAGRRADSPEAIAQKPDLPLSRATEEVFA